MFLSTSLFSWLQLMAMPISWTQGNVRFIWTKRPAIDEEEICITANQLPSNIAYFPIPNDNLVDRAKRIIGTTIQQTSSKDLRTNIVHNLEEWDALCVICKYEPEEWERILLRLEQGGEPKKEIRIIDNLVKGRLKRYESKVPNAEKMPLISVAESIGNLIENEESLVPKGYLLTEAGIRYQIDEQETIYASLLAKTICPVPVIVTERSRSNDRIDFLEISWYAEDEWHRATVKRRDLDGNAWLKPLRDQGFPFAGIEHGELKEYLSSFEGVNLERLEKVESVGKLGWHRSESGDLGFFHGYEFLRHAWEGGNPRYYTEDIGTDQIARGFHCKGSLYGWSSALASTLLFFPAVRWGVYAGFSAPLLDIFDCPSFIVDYGYRTSMGKSTTLKIIASIWGNPVESDPNSAIRTWDSTYSSIGRILGNLNSLPLILDETKLAKDAQDIADVIYLVANGRERSRATVSGIQTSGTWKTVLFSSGEKPITSFTSDGGTRGRVLGFHNAPFGGKDEDVKKLIHRVTESITENYGHAGRAFVFWLLKNLNKKEQWINLWKKRRDHYASLAETAVSGRLAEYMAVIDVAAQLLPEAIEFPVPYEESVMMRVWGQVLEGVEEEAEELRALRCLYDWAQENRKRFGNGPSDSVDHCAGRWDEDGDFIAFMPTQFEQILETNELDINWVKRRFKELGWINTDKNELLKKVRMNGLPQPIRAIVLNLNAIPL